MDTFVLLSRGKDVMMFRHLFFFVSYFIESNGCRSHSSHILLSEMINQNLGYSDRAERTMDIYTAAVLAEKLTQRVTPSQSWRDMMKKLSEISCDRYVHSHFGSSNLTMVTCSN
jgi:Phosphoenolpyruvate carboxylase